MYHGSMYPLCRSVIRPFLPFALFEQSNSHVKSLSEEIAQPATFLAKARQGRNYGLVIHRISPSQPYEAVQKPLGQVRNHAAALRHLIHEGGK
jgi:hypothetical protein